ncbi:calcium channel protein [Elasticomyces elasticus]|nr:calcium channel protein [Elasticomyces elasticus]KAK4977557.1 calcium channel protein [Elasticomyces elasticus]
MASDDPSHRRNQSASAIPLQDLNSVGASSSPSPSQEQSSSSLGVNTHSSQHRRTLSDRGRALFIRNRDKAENISRQYAPIRERSPSPPPPQPPIAIVTSPSGLTQRIPDPDDEANLSPVEDRGAFQAAIGFAGLSFNAHRDSPTDEEEEDRDHELDGGGFRDTMPPTVRGTGRASRPKLPSIRTVPSPDPEEDMVSIELRDGPMFFSPISGPAAEDDDDTVPLTDSSRLRAQTLRAPVTPTGQRHDRLKGRERAASNLTVSFSPRHGRSNSRLGDDLRGLEDGNSSQLDGHTPSSSHSRRQRSLSPGESPFHRTGTMLRKMSQRVVNVSNDSDMLEREALRQRKSSSVRPMSHIPPSVTELSGSSSFDGNMDGLPRSPTTSEKMPASPVFAMEPERMTPVELPVIDRNPLRGKSLGVFAANSPVRKRLLKLLVHPLFEPLILLLIVVQTIILAVDAASSVHDDPRATGWGKNWTDYTLLGIFCVYTFEVGIKVIVSGFIFNPREYSTIDRSVSFRKALANKANELFALHRKPSIIKGGGVGRVEDAAQQVPPSLLRSFTKQDMGEGDVPGGSRQAQKLRLAHRAFLRHSFNRLDFLAVASFWVSFLLAATGVEARHHLYVFRMLSCLRIVRLLGITSGTSVILRSLKSAAPTLLNVGVLIGFFWLLFAIVGVQSFKSSLRRTCVWNWQQEIYPNLLEYNQNQIGSFQFCGGYLSATNGTPTPWLKPDGSWGADSPKGYYCPRNSTCVEGSNPYNGTMSFDNILQSTELVFVIMTSNTFSDIMYYLTDSDYLAAALFFAAGIVILSLWLLNLLIAVITSSFQVIREESRSSAFMAAEDHDLGDEMETQFAADRPKRKSRGLKMVYERCHWLWIVVIVYGLVVQCMRTAYIGPGMERFINISELAVMFVLLGEIVFRFAADWREFPYHRRNWVDLVLAVVTMVIQIPSIRTSGQPYAWLTVFQIVRIYRVVLAVKLTRDLITLVLRHVSGILNLILFVFLLTFLAAIFASQLFRGQLPLEDDQGNTVNVNFGSIYNSFLGMYQILSSENWTTILYDVTRFNVQYHTAWIGAAFFILWFILAFFIVLNMFIAVIQENFDVSEDQKRLQQVRMFLQQRETQLGSSNSGTLSLSRIFKFGYAKRQDPLDFGNAAVDMLLKDAVVKDFLDDDDKEDDQAETSAAPSGGPVKHTTTDFIRESSGWLEQGRDWVVKKFLRREANPFYARLQLSKAYEELDPHTLAREVVEATEQRKVTQREYLRQHPNYNVSLFMFGPDNPVRRFCQRIVGPGRGSERAQGRAPNPAIWYGFSIFIYLAIVAMVILACITTPLYQQEYFKLHPGVSTRFNWFVYSDMGFAALFAIEAIIKVVADGFFWTPNAYFRSSWGFIDGVVLITLWVNVITALYDPGGGSRAVGAFKALRALRLLNVSDSARDTFHSVIVLGGWKVVSAAFVSLSLLIPFAIYGLNLFAGQMQSCNDGSGAVYNLSDCVGEYMTSPYNWEFPAPRQVGNSYYSFDSFGDALFILFQIVSQEGWIDVMNAAESVTGVFTQPNSFSRQGNALFFVIFNLLGAVFVLTLFVSVFMRNYTEQTGVAFLTTDQRSWLELRKLLRQVSPSKRPNTKKKRATWQEWCYRRAVTKTGRWQRAMTGLLVVHLILLCLEWYPEPWIYGRIRDYIFLLFTVFYIAHIVIRVIGLSWTRFRKSAWDVYSVFAVSGTFVTTILMVTNFQNRNYVQLHKLFLVAVALMLIPRNNQLDQLFKTAAASFTAIANLLATWFVLFLVFAIALSQTFGLTRFNTNESGNINVRTVPKALILLFRISVGEGWNQIMNDFSSVEWPYCTIGDRYLESDCGSEQWAWALFIAWNILSMYIFVNLFISLIYESFSYVYQRSSGLSVISREEIRRFKQAWAEFDPNGTGYMSKEVFPRFLGELSGVFEMRIYDGDFAVRSLIEDCRVTTGGLSALPVDGSSGSFEIDLDKLNRRLCELPVQQIRARRARMNTFYEEVLVSADPDRGISFNALLMILAHYKVINDNKSLKLEEYLRRRARLQRVEEAVNRNVVVGFFDTLYWARRFRRAMDAKKSARMTAIPSFGVPEIFVHGEDDDVTQAPKFEVPSLSVTPVDFDPSDTADSLALGRAPTSGSDAGSGRSTALGSTMRNRSGSIQHLGQDPDLAVPYDGSPRLSARHRPSASASSIQPDWHFAAAMEGAAPGVTPPGSPGLAPTTPAPSRSRANSAVSQNEMSVGCEHGKDYDDETDEPEPPETAVFMMECVDMVLGDGLVGVQATRRDDRYGTA